MSEFGIFGCVFSTRKSVIKIVHTEHNKACDRHVASVFCTQCIRNSSQKEPFTSNFKACRGYKKRSRPNKNKAQSEKDKKKKV